MKNTLTVAVLALAIGSAMGYYAPHFLPTSHSDHASTKNSAVKDAPASNEPLYWVAPMDPNYQRDKPGKSPMGMDLIPVYADDLKSDNADKPGTVTISPSVENNLGVKTAAVTEQALTPHIDTVGYVAFDEGQRWQINSRISGWVQRLNVTAVGEAVTRGETLFEIYSPDLVRAQEELLNAKRIGNATLVNGARERLIALGVDNAQITQILRQRQAKQAIAIKAPADGVIATLNIRQGAYVSPQQTVISGGPLDNVWIEAEVFEQQAHWIQSGTTAEIQVDALPGQQWLGTVDYIYPILDPATRTLRMRLNVANPDGALKPNMFAKLVLIPRSEAPVIVVPEQAVIRTGNMSRVVLALGDGKYRSTRIEIGRSANGMMEVTQGLSPQDRVVTSAQFMLDSESSQNAELDRINQPLMPSPPSNQLIISGLVRNSMPAHNMVTIDHPAIPEWDWPAMTMDFTVSDDSDLSQLTPNLAIRFQLTKTEDGQYTVSDIQPDHSQMDHSSMNHGNMTTTEGHNHD